MRIITLVILSLAAYSPGMAASIAVIGTGNVGSALGPEFAAQGHMIIYGSRDPSTAKIEALVARTGNGATADTPAIAANKADIVVLAVPGKYAEQIVEGLGDLAGKIIIDPTNAPLRADPDFKLPAHTSIAELVQRAAPRAHVVKAFNTLSTRIMVDPAAAGGPVSVPLAGDDDAAKAVVAELVSSLGLQAIDVGPLEWAYWVEGMANLLINNMFNAGQRFNFYLRMEPVVD